MSQIIATQRDLLPQFVPPRGFVPVHPGEHGGRAHWNDILRKAVQRCLPTAAKSSADEVCVSLGLSLSLSPSLLLRPFPSPLSCSCPRRR